MLMEKTGERNTTKVYKTVDVNVLNKPIYVCKTCKLANKVTESIILRYILTVVFASQVAVSTLLSRLICSDSLQSRGAMTIT